MGRILCHRRPREDHPNATGLILTLDLANGSYAIATVMPRSFVLIGCYNSHCVCGVTLNATSPGLKSNSFLIGNTALLISEEIDL